MFIAVVVGAIGAFILFVGLALALNLKTKGAPEYSGANAAYIKRASYIIAIVGVAILAADVGWYKFVRVSSSHPKKCGTESMAYVMSQQFVEQRLRAPASAKFPLMPTAMSTRVGACEFSVRSYVDAQNGFGAMIRSHYDVIMTYDRSSDRWVASGLNMSQ